MNFRRFIGKNLKKLLKDVPNYSPKKNILMESIEDLLRELFGEVSVHVIPVEIS